MKKMMKKAEYGVTMKDPKSKKPVPKPAVKKSTDPAPKKRTYPIIPDEVTNEGYLKLGPREKTPGGGFSRNGSMMKKAKSGASMMKKGGAMKKCKYGCK
jgi:hypothetical protein